MENDHVTGNIKDIMADTADQALKNDVPATLLIFGDNSLFCASHLSKLKPIRDIGIKSNPDVQTLTEKSKEYPVRRVRNQSPATRN